ncbi:sn-glycerol-3-phosphate ABC transporter ATP-binding protein UgpC [Halobacteria archaeon AArc-m2/3/4]|uniref:Sn-glycerol-3-phosphate ABC transporter ATP-binding protein UgpC n=1 Tax=Natronoglomus mannanivorans TaxID=2979990 RepID=A0ABT2QEV8_9EURY|nr:sn-glycerol-3-phosphate ABC transporter ATP-binding protein UgpC [Halobacteria archaeon AArc-m2/3/4]
MSSVRFDEVRKVYDDEIVAVDGCTLDIEDGEFVTIVGPSGSGKSTLLRMVAGLEDITGGNLHIGDRRVNNVAPQNRGVAMVFQNYALYPHMSVRKNMSYGLKLTTDLSDDEIERRIMDAAEMMGIEDLLEDKPSQLSGGQQQRVATGRAIVREPDVFLMDEPLSNLDAKLRTHMRIELQRLQEDLETTTIYVTHDQEEALTMSDRVVILNHGELQQVGTPENVYHEPVNRFVADFIGSPSMNFFDVELHGTTLTGGAFTYDLPGDLANRIQERMQSESLVLGVRPEHIKLSEPGVENAIEAEVAVLEPVGSDNYVYIDIGDLECTVRVPGDVKPEEGSRVHVTFDPTDIHLFDGETSKNIMLEAKQVASVDSV